MRAVLLAFSLSAPAVAQDLAAMFPGTYTNEEEVYFENEAGRAHAPWTGMTIGPAGLTAIDRYGVAQGKTAPLAFSGATIRSGQCLMPYRAERGGFSALPRQGVCHNAIVISRIAPEGVTLTLPNGRSTMLRRARPVTCWGAIPKDAKKPDGVEDWYGARDLKLHDQGGRVRFGGGDTGAKPAVLRIRNVVWPSGPNKPSLILYVHTPDDPERAAGYSWADPGARRIGINLRWMQASCTVDDPQGESP